MKKKINEALKKICITEDGRWFVPNRKMLKMSFKEFMEFERQRLLEFEFNKEKYWAHYGFEKPKKIKQLTIFD